MGSVPSSTLEGHLYYLVRRCRSVRRHWRLAALGEYKLHHTVGPSQGLRQTTCGQQRIVTAPVFGSLYGEQTVSKLQIGVQSMMIGPPPPGAALMPPTLLPILAKLGLTT